METKHYIGLILMAGLACAGAVVLLIWPRLRTWTLFGVVFGSITTIDINLFGQYWYRGTSRGLEISVIDVIAFSLVVAEFCAPRYERRKWFWPAGLGLFMAYLIYCTVSVATSTPKIYGVWELGNVARGGLMIMLGALMVRSRRELGVVVAALACAVCVQSVYALKQRYIGGIYRVPGTFDHENTLSTYLCTVAPLLLAAAFSHWSIWLRWACGLVCAVAFPLELLTISRAGIPIFLFGLIGVTFFCVTWRITARKIVVGSAVALVGLVLFAATWDQIKKRYASASFAEEYLDKDNEGRGVYFRWAGLMADDHFFGVGLNNWSYYVSKTYGAKLGFHYEDYDQIVTSPEKADLPAINYAAPAHSLVALTIGELGFPGLALMGLVWLRWFQMGAGFLRRRLNADPMHRLGIGCLFALLGVFFSNATEWTYRQPTIVFLCHFVVGMLASLYYERRHAFVEPDNEAWEEQESEPALETEDAPSRIQ